MFCTQVLQQTDVGHGNGMLFVLQYMWASVAAAA
jgi:hypothetical protein